MECRSHPSSEVSFELTPSRAAPGAARAGLRPVADSLPPTAFLDLSAVVSELVSSCVRRRMQGAVRIEVSVRSGIATGAVLDGRLQPPQSDAAPEAGEAKAGDAELIGRRILDALCREWGSVERDGSGGIGFSLPAAAGPEDQAGVVQRR